MWRLRDLFQRAVPCTLQPPPEGHLVPVKMELRLNFTSGYTLSSHLQMNLDGLSLKLHPISNIQSALESSSALPLSVYSILLLVNIKEN